MTPFSTNEERELDAAQKERTLECHILVVDDEELNRLLIEQYLHAAGYQNISFAADGLETLTFIKRHFPDLVILDIMMPGLDGFQVCQGLREVPDFKNLPVLVQTALDTPEERSQIFQAGATDLITKPLNEDELVARVKIHLENRLLIQDLVSFRDRLSADLDAARQMQMALLPTSKDIRDVEERHGVRLAARFEPSAELGGDLWTVFDLPHAVGLLVLDISGHGVAAAINAFRAHALVSEMGDIWHCPDRLLAALNNRLADLLPLGQFATAFYCVLDRRGGRLSYAASASPSPILVSPAGSEFSYLDGRGLPLGIRRGTEYPLREVTMEAGASLVCYSDGISESMLPDGTMLGEDKLASMVREVSSNGHVAFEALIANLFDRVRTPLDDDLTLVSLTFSGKEPGSGKELGSGKEPGKGRVD